MGFYEFISIKIGSNINMNILTTSIGKECKLTTKINMNIKYKQKFRFLLDRMK